MSHTKTTETALSVTAGESLISCYNLFVNRYKMKFKFLISVGQFNIHVYGQRVNLPVHRLS